MVIFCQIANFPHFAQHQWITGSRQERIFFQRVQKLTSSFPTKIFDSLVEKSWHKFFEDMMIFQKIFI